MRRGREERTEERGRRGREEGREGGEVSVKRKKSSP